MHADGVIGAGEDDAPDPVPPRALINGVKADEVVFDHLRQRPFDAGARHVDQDIDAGEQAVHVRRVAQVAMGEVLAGTERLQRLGPARGAQIDAPFEQGRAQETSQLATGTGQRGLGHPRLLKRIRVAGVSASIGVREGWTAAEQAEALDRAADLANEHAVIAGAARPCRTRTAPRVPRWCAATTSGGAWHRSP